MDDDNTSEDILQIQGQALIAYRLGRVEKTVDSINTASVARDDRILDKMESIATVVGKVDSNTYRIELLETKFHNIYKFLAGIALSLAAIVSELIFNLV